MSLYNEFASAQKKRMKRQELKYDIIYYLGLVSSYISLLLSLYTYVWLYRYIQSTLIFVVTLLSAQNLATVSPSPVIEKGLKWRIIMNSIQVLFHEHRFNLGSIVVIHSWILGKNIWVSKTCNMVKKMAIKISQHLLFAMALK